MKIYILFHISVCYSTLKRLVLIECPLVYVKIFVQWLMSAYIHLQRCLFSHLILVSICPTFYYSYLHIPFTRDQPYFFITENMLLYLVGNSHYFVVTAIGISLTATCITYKKSINISIKLANKYVYTFAVI